MSIYVASKSKMGPEWKDWRAAGVPIISTWIDECGEGQSVLPELWMRCIQEAASAEVLVLVHREGEVQKGALVEMGAALMSGAVVIWVGPDYLTAQHHPSVRRAKDVEEAMGMAMSIVAKNPPDPEAAHRRGWTWRTVQIVRAIAKRTRDGDVVSGIRMRLVSTNIADPRLDLLKGQLRTIHEPEVTLVFTTVVIPALAVDAVEPK